MMIYLRQSILFFYTLLYSKESEKYYPYGNEWYMNYASISMIANDYDMPYVYESFEEIEKKIY